MPGRPRASWWCLILRLLGHEGVNAGKPDPEADEQAVAMLFPCLDEFLRLREEHDGLHRIFAAHASWTAARDRAGCGATARPPVEYPMPRDPTNYETPVPSGP